MQLVIAVAAVYGLMSLCTFVLYALDKRAARRSTPRVSEMTLHLCELLGGFPGGFFAQRVIRHKNAKLRYQVVFWLIVAVHAVAWGTVVLGTVVLGPVPWPLR